MSLAYRRATITFISVKINGVAYKCENGTNNNIERKLVKLFVRKNNGERARDSRGRQLHRIMVEMQQQHQPP